MIDFTNITVMSFVNPCFFFHNTYILDIAPKNLAKAREGKIKSREHIIVQKMHITQL